jgi:cytochrome c6
VHARCRLILMLLLVICSAVLLAACGGSSAPRSSTVPLSTNGLGTIRLTAAQASGEQLFKSTCGSCHTLGAAHTTGTVGPNLDQLRPPAPAVIETINSGLGAMPAHLLTGKKEQDVADFVAAVTAH